MAEDYAVEGLSNIFTVVLGGINFCSHDYCVKFNTVITILYTYYSMSIYAVKVKL